MTRSTFYVDYINSTKWKKISKEAIESTNRHCVVFPWWKSKKMNTHHLHYDDHTTLNGKEKLIRDIVPLGEFAHSIVHGVFWVSKHPDYSSRKLCNLVLRFLYPSAWLIGHTPWILNLPLKVVHLGLLILSIPILFIGLLITEYEKRRKRR